jgi:hypothetical protein
VVLVVIDESGNNLREMRRNEHHRSSMDGQACDHGQGRFGSVMHVGHAKRLVDYGDGRPIIMGGRELLSGRGPSYPGPCGRSPGRTWPGKSTFLKAVATAVLLAHCGCGVPAAAMEFPCVGTIFSSVEIVDNLSAIVHG